MIGFLATGFVMGIAAGIASGVLASVIILTCLDLAQHYREEAARLWRGE